MCPSGFAWSSISRTCISLPDTAALSGGLQTDLDNLNTVRASSIYEGTALNPSKQEIITPSLVIGSTNDTLTLRVGTTSTPIAIARQTYASIDLLLIEIQTKLRTSGVLGSTALVQFTLNTSQTAQLITVIASTPTASFMIDNTLLARQLGFRDATISSSGGRIQATALISMAST
jgi:hypothetical protein